MKITIQRTEQVTNNMLVEFSSAGTVQPYSTGDFAGVAEECREITMTEQLDSENSSAYKICTLVIKDSCIARLSGTASQNGSDAFVNGSSVYSTGSNKIGLIVPKPFPNPGDYVDWDLVNIVLV